jgi:hypothetical protein
MKTEVPTAFPWSHGDLTCTGMTLRDYFAAKAMQVLMAETDGINDDNPGSPRWQSNTVAELAYEQADVMLEARGKYADS